MTYTVFIAHARGEESLVERLAVPLRDAGYNVAHEGTVLVGESVVAETSRILEQGGPVVLCGTEHAIGNKFVRLLANAARRVDNGRLFIVQMEAEADIESLSFGEKIASYWQDSNRAIGDLLAAMRRYYPLDDADAAQRRTLGGEERYRSLLLEACDIVNLANLPEQDRHIAQKQQELKLRGLYIPLRAHIELGVADIGEPASAEGLLKTLEERRSSQVRDWLRTKTAVDRKTVAVGDVWGSSSGS